MALSAPLLEIIAHERLTPALRSAFHYVLAVRARPGRIAQQTVAQPDHSTRSASAPCRLTQR
jgi:hypothetical protein